MTTFFTLIQSTRTLRGFSIAHLFVAVTCCVSFCSNANGDGADSKKGILSGGRGVEMLFSVDSGAGKIVVSNFFVYCDLHSLNGVQECK